MTIVTIITNDPSQPTEVQAWLDANPDVIVARVLVNGNIFYVMY